MVKRKSQSDHDRIVRYVADFLVTKNYSAVRADIPGFDQPMRITWTNTGQGHIPDVTAQGQQFNLFEVETADSIDDPHTRDQWSLFATYAGGHNAVFWVVVPNGSGVAARRRLTQLGIAGKVWEV